MNTGTEREKKKKDGSGGERGRAGESGAAAVSGRRFNKGGELLRHDTGGGGKRITSTVRQREHRLGNVRP